MIARSQRRRASRRDDLASPDHEDHRRALRKRNLRERHVGDREGVVFIPPHLLKEIVERAEANALKDEWMKTKLREGKHKSSEIYASQLSPELQKDYDAFVRSRGGK